MISRRTARGALAAIVVIAACLRLYYFVGFVGGDPQDDFIYYSTAYALYNDGNTQLDRLRDQPAHWMPNPVDQFLLRPVVTYPIAALFWLFGPGEVVAALWALLCSLATVVIVYRIGEVMHDRVVGLVAALLCAIYPLEVILSTRILSEAPTGMFIALAVWMLVDGEWRSSAWRYGLAGAAIAAAYLANPRGLIVLPFLIAWSCLQWRSSREPGMWRAPLLVVTGFLGVFAIEGLVYWFAVGDPFVTYRTQARASYFKYLYEPVESIEWSWLKVSFTNGRPFDLFNGVFLRTDRPNQFGLFFFMFTAAALFSIVVRRNVAMVLFAVALFLYMEFGAIKVELEPVTSKLHYLMVFKQDRFAIVLSAPLLVLSAYMLRSIARVTRAGFALLLTALIASSVDAIAETHGFYRAGLADMRAVSWEVRNHPDRVYFTDGWAIENIKIFTRHRAENMRALGPETTATEVAGDCIIIGGSRGVELMADYVEAVLPAFLRDVLRSHVAPPGWSLVRVVDGAHTPQRLHDLYLYCAADSEALNQPPPR